MVYQTAAYQIMPQVRTDNKQIVTTSEQFQRMLNHLQDARVICFDFETSGLDWYGSSESCGLALAAERDGDIQCYYVPYRHQTGEEQLSLQSVAPAIEDLLDTDSTKIAHNIKFDAHMAQREKWRVSGPWYDTMIAAHFFDENRLIGLKDRALVDLGERGAKESEKVVKAEVARQAKLIGVKVSDYRNKYGYSTLPIELGGIYACYDVECTYRLYQFYESQGISSNFSRIWNTEMGLTRALTEMEYNGLPVDVPYMTRLRENLAVETERLERAVFGIMDYRFNLNSDDDVRELLIGRLGLPLHKRTKTNQLSVDKEVLQEFQDRHPVLPPLLQYRTAEKLLNTYTTSVLSRLDEYNVLHTDFKQVGTKTGRLSCERPNFQNFPSDSNKRSKEATGLGLKEGGADPYSIRRAFGPRGPEWVRLFFDYSQIELRVLAYYSRDPILVDTYKNGEDAHSRTSKEVFGSDADEYRRLAKVINFGLSYCMSPPGFARQTGVTVVEAERHFNSFFQRYQGIDSFRKRFWSQIRSTGGEFYNLFGRRRRLPNINSSDPYQCEQAQRQAIASLIQGTAAELTKESIVRVHTWLKENNIPALLCNTVHDEIQIDVPREYLAQVVAGCQHYMQHYPEFDPIPIVVDAEYSLKSWADKQSIKG